METGIEDILYLTLRETNMTAQQLKNSILQMAVQGKLVPQDPNDEPASVLLERIRAEKEKLIKEGKIKKEKNPSVIFRGEDNLPYEKIGKNEPICIADEVPFEIPESWEWVRLKSISIKEIKRGKSPTYTEKSSVFVFAQKCNVKSGGIDMTLAKCLDMSSFAKYPEEEYMQNEDIVVNSTGNGTLGRIGLFRDTDRINDYIIVPDSHVTIIRTTEKVYRDYVLCVLEYYQPALEKLGEGSTNQTELKPSVLAELLIPVPSIEEQRRIVSSLAGLRAYISNYGQKERNLSLLNKEFPELLKKSILQQAVMGKLVSQDENDEPASVLLEKIRTEKQALIKAGKLKKDKYESIIYRRDNSHYEKLDGVERCIDDEIPFDIPDSWEWVRLGSLFVLLSGTDFKPEQYNDRGDGLPYITGASNLGNHGVIINRWTEFPQVIAERGDVLLVCKGSGYGRTMICNITSAHIARQIMAFKLMKSINMDYLICFLEANYDVLKSRGQGVIPGIDRRSVLSLLFPLPPLAEQGRIIAKAVQLTKLCNLL